MKLKNRYNLSQNMYIVQSGFEYLVTILVTGSFLATITKHLGISDSLTGIIASFVSLGSTFQLLSLLLRKRRYKPLVVTLTVVNQLLFMLLYIVPLISGSKTLKTGLFVFLIFSAYTIFYLIAPKKTNILMSAVPDEQRGIFTADKEIVSLLAGMIFSFSMGAVFDHFVALGKLRTAFILAACVMCVLSAIQITSLVLVKEDVATAKSEKKAFSLQTLFRDKNILCIMVLFSFYYIITHSASPFFSTYLLGELGLNLKFVSLLSILSSISRVLVSRFWGRYADRNSFASMFEKCLILMGVAFLFAAFATPQNGKIFFALYYIFHGAAMAGTNSSLINLVYDYSKVENRSQSLAICQAIPGLVGFIATIAFGALVSSVQENGNRFLGMPIYAQQVASVITVLIIIATIIFVHTVIKKMKKQG